MLTSTSPLASALAFTAVSSTPDSHSPIISLLDMDAIDIVATAAVHDCALGVWWRCEQLGTWDFDGDIGYVTVTVATPKRIKNILGNPPRCASGIFIEAKTVPAGATLTALLLGRKQRA